MSGPDHVPVVRIVNRVKATQRIIGGHGTTVEVDGVEWPVIRWEAENGVNQAQEVTLTFLARLHVEEVEVVDDPTLTTRLRGG